MTKPFLAKYYVNVDQSNSESDTFTKTCTGSTKQKAFVIPSFLIQHYLNVNQPDSENVQYKTTSICQVCFS